MLPTCYLSSAPAAIGSRQLSQGIFKGLLTAVIVSLLCLMSRFAQADEVTLAQVVPTQTILGQGLQKRAGDSGAAARSKKLDTLPVGGQVFKTIFEVNNLQDLKPGDKVDVALVTLGEEHAESERILRDLTVYSVGVVKGEADPTVEDAEKVEEPAAYPTRVVGLVVDWTQLAKLRVAEAQGMLRLSAAKVKVQGSMLSEIGRNFTTNLFQPLLLFFFLGFSVPLLKVPLEFPKPLYQALTIYLLVAIGWHGGELMAALPSAELAVAGGLAVVGFVINMIIAILATYLLRATTRMRRIDAATVGAYYGSDSAGTFVTCLGILAALNILHDSYMPVMLAVMETPGCLVGLFMISKMRRHGMDSAGNMPGEPGYLGDRGASVHVSDESHGGHGHTHHSKKENHEVAKSVGAMATRAPKKALFDLKVLHEVFLNPGLFLLFGGIVVGFIAGRQAIVDPHIVEGPNHLFLFLFKGALCLFLLEMGITACERLRDLKTAGPGFIAFGLLAPNLFAVIGMLTLHAYSMVLGHHFELGTYALFAVLCGAASYIAVPAVQRMAIPEASPTLPLAASLGLTFTWNVTLGIPIYIEIAKKIVQSMPIA